MSPTRLLLALASVSVLGLVAWLSSADSRPPASAAWTGVAQIEGRHVDRSSADHAPPSRFDCRGEVVSRSKDCREGPEGVGGMADAGRRREILEGIAAAALIAHGVLRVAGRNRRN